MEKYCKYCGKELKNGAHYCGYCGELIEKISKYKNEYTRNKVDNDDLNDTKIMNELDRELSYFKQKQPEYDFIDSTDLIEFNFKANGLFIIVGFIPVALMTLILGRSTLILFLFWLPWLVLSIFIGIWMYKKWKQKDEYDYIKEELISNYMAYDGAIVSFELSSPRILELLIDNISTGRAATLEESINCFCEDLNQKQILANQKAIAKQAKDAEIIATYAYINSLKK